MSTDSGGILLIKGVIFDMDGLMYNTEPVWGAALTTVTERLGLEYLAGFPDAVRGTAGVEFDKVVHEWYGEHADAKEVWDVWHELVEERFKEGVEKKPGLDELLEYLKGEGLPMAVASSSTIEQIRHNNEISGVADMFDVVLSSLEVAHAKPEPDVFLRAAELLGCKPEETLVLEDSFNGVRAGAAGGFVTVMVPDLSAPDDEMRGLADRICSSLVEVRDLLVAGELG